MSKSFRQGQILKLIRAKAISTQDDLAQELKKQGVAATQVTLSRDIRELGLAKTADGYRQFDPAASTGPEIETIAAEFLQDIRVAQNLIVLRTSPGNANALAAALDRQDWREIVGTIAGDDTVLVIAPDHATAESVRRKFLAMIERAG